MRKQKLMITNGGGYIDYGKSASLEVNEAPLLMNSVKDGNVIQSNVELRRIQAMADEHGILLPCELNRRIRPTTNSQNDNNEKQGQRTSEPPLLLNVKY
jgi:hypothetical protein